MFKAMSAVDLHKTLGKIIERSRELPTGDGINVNAPIVLTVGSDPEALEYDEFSVYSVVDSEFFEGVVLGITTDL